MLRAADNALQSAADSEYWRSELDNKFGKAIELLSDFARDFPVKDPTLDPNIGGTVTEEVKMSDKSKSPMTILQALKNDLHSKVKFHLYFYPSTLMDTSQCAMKGHI